MAVDRRSALLDAARRAILSAGYAGASTRRIAQEAGVPLSLLHYHFGGKEGLLVALIERERDQYRVDVHASVRSDAPPAQRLTDALNATRRRFVDDADTIRLLLEIAVAALHNERLRAAIQELYHDILGLMGVHVQAVSVSSPHQPTGQPQPIEAMAALMMATGFGLALQRTLGAQPRVVDDALALLGQLLVRHLAESS